VTIASVVTVGVIGAAFNVTVTKNRTLCHCRPAEARRCRKIRQSGRPSEKSPASLEWLPLMEPLPAARLELSLPSLQPAEFAYSLPFWSGFGLWSPPSSRVIP
jgi:hypothetical protein